MCLLHCELPVYLLIYYALLLGYALIRVVGTH